jgi:glyoxylase-like metal-dependent hydrolase (beta-lactamase superfamily II)
VRIKIVDCGDAFGSGGRRNTCFPRFGGRGILSRRLRRLVPAGAQGGGIDLSAIDFIFLSHFHGDHSGGAPFFVLDAQNWWPSEQHRW